MPQVDVAAVMGPLFDHLPCGLVIRSAEGGTVIANRRAGEMLGIDPARLTVEELARWHVTDADGHELEPAGRPAAAVFARGPIRNFEMRLTRPDGQEIWLRVDSVAFDDASGRRFSATSFIDITERGRADQARRQQAAETERMLSIVNARHRQQEAIADLGRTALLGVGTQELMNQACRLVASALPADRVRVLELRPRDRSMLLRAGIGWREGLVGSALIQMDGSQAGYLLDSNEPLIIEDLREDRRFQVSWLLMEHPVASGIRAVIRGSEHPFGEIAAYTTTHRTFNDDDIYFLRAIANVLAVALIRLHASDQLTRTLKQLRETDAARRGLLRRLAAAVEEERARIARDVHDDALQALAALGIRLQLLGEGLDRPGQKETVTQIVGSLQRSTERLRRLIFDLRPDVLEVGLEPAIRFYFEQTRSESDPALLVRSHLEFEPPPDQRLAMYRACQEAINNVRKHARAQHVSVDLDPADGGLRMVVRDDGQGFRVASGRRPGHLGLTAMRERAELLGGTCRVTSRRGRGTTVSFWFPTTAAAGS